ncbi:MAG TPA: ATP-binding protein [Spirochaetia bacterium]|nr:ATP-binding protein [Spirochaetia bacterium]
MDWTRLYIRFSLALILYIIYVMILPAFSGAFAAASLIAVVPVVIAATVRVWPALFLSLVNIPVTLIIVGRALRVPVLDSTGPLLPSFAMVVIAGILSGLLVRNRRERDRLQGDLAAALSDRDSFRAGIGEGLDRMMETIRMLAGLEATRAVRNLSSEPADPDAQSETARADLLPVADISRHLAFLPQIYAILYAGTTSPTDVDAGHFLQDVVERHLERIRPTTVEFNPELDTWRIGPREALLLGQAVTEMVQNAVQFGTGVDTDAIIDLELEVDGDLAELRLTDHGAGFPEPVLYNQRIAQHGLGIPLIRTIVATLGGDLRLVNETGACCIVKFPVILAKPSG